ncbi:hypothetical protein A5645_07705 [Mycobacterium asiaticum]|nr:hypothetical protein A5645_07705 [Mycobacterium asiaticum]
MRGAAGAIKDLERRQKSRQTRASRDALDRALIDLATYFRDALVVSADAGGAGASAKYVGSGGHGGAGGVPGLPLGTGTGGLGGPGGTKGVILGEDGLPGPGG